MNRSVIFITGAASGIGKATAKLFSAKGWFVGATDINEGDLPFPSSRNFLAIALQRSWMSRTNRNSMRSWLDLATR